MANFSYITSLLKNSTAKLKKTNSKRIVYDKLEQLNAQIQNLNRTEPVEGGEEGQLKPHTMSEQEYNELLNNYNALRDSIMKANNAKANSIVQQQLDELMLMVNRDLEALHHVDPAHLSDYKSMVNDSTHYTADIRGKQLDRAAGASSSRLAMSVPDGKGGYVDGYFTPDSRLIPDMKLKEAFKTAIRGCQENERLCEALEKAYKKKMKTLDVAGQRLFGDPDFKGESRVYVDRCSPGYVIDDPKAHQTRLSKMWNNLLEIQPPVEINEDQLKTLYSMTNEIFNIGFSKGFMRNNAYVLEGGVIGQRNAAMSAVADYLGVPELIARSSQISVLVGTKDGKPVYRNGTFMEKVYGEDPINPQRLIDSSVYKTELETLAMKKAVANLQVLDYICGNVDRHTGNYFVKSEIKDHKLVMTGIVGFDNDNSFGEVNIDTDTHLLRAPAHMGFITKDMADRLSKMTKKDLQQVLAGFGLRTNEINAAWNRVEALRKYIEIHKSMVKDDDAMKAVKLQDFSRANKTERKNDDPANTAAWGIGTACSACVSALNKAYKQKFAYFNARMEQYKKDFLASHPECKKRNGKDNIPAEELKKLQERAIFVSDKQSRALNLMEHKQNVMNNYIAKAVKIMFKNNNVDLSLLSPQMQLNVRKKAEEVCIMEAEEKALKDYDEKINAPEKNDNEPVVPANEAADNRATRLTDRASRLAEVQKKLKDIINTFEPTRKDHGMTGTCKRMYDSMKKLYQTTKELKNQEIANPDQYDIEAWKKFDKELKEAFDNTCYYISQKPLTPRHQYGRDRLDVAHELRTCTLNALQMANDEMLVASGKVIQNPIIQEQKVEMNQKDIQAGPNLLLK